MAELNGTISHCVFDRPTLSGPLKWPFKDDAFRRTFEALLCKKHNAIV